MSVGLLLVIRRRERRRLGGLVRRPGQSLGVCSLVPLCFFMARPGRVVLWARLGQEKSFFSVHEVFPPAGRPHGTVIAPVGGAEERRVTVWPPQRNLEWGFPGVDVPRRSGVAERSGAQVEWGRLPREASALPWGRRFGGVFVVFFLKGGRAIKRGGLLWKAGAGAGGVDPDGAVKSPLRVQIRV